MGVSCVLGRVGPADELRAKVSQVCASRYGLAVRDWYALVTRLPGVVVGSQGGKAGREAVMENKEGRGTEAHTCRCSGTRGYMNFLGGRKGQNWDNE